MFAISHSAIAIAFEFDSYIHKLLETGGRWEKLAPVAQHSVDGHDVAGPVPERSRGLEYRQGGCRVQRIELYRGGPELREGSGYTYNARMRCRR